MRATCIEWDVDAPDELDLLPPEIELPDDLAPEDISDYLSDLTGFCHKGYCLDEDN